MLCEKACILFWWSHLTDIVMEESILLLSVLFRVGGVEGKNVEGILPPASTKIRLNVPGHTKHWFEGTFSGSSIRDSFLNRCHETGCESHSFSHSDDKIALPVPTLFRSIKHEAYLYYDRRCF